jgi:hypothetical protein
MTHRVIALLVTLTLANLVAPLAGNARYRRSIVRSLGGYGTSRSCGG